MSRLSQSSAPVYEALKKYRADRVVPFDVPGHKGGKGTPELTRFLGQDCLKADVNSMKPLDNLSHPVSVIKDAEQLAADAFGAAHAFFMVDGTTLAVQAMIFAAVGEGDKIIMPRNVHRSAINALVINGAVPVYVNPGSDKRLGIPLGMSPEDVKAAIEQNRDAKAVFVNNPTYYGICSDIVNITKMAHEAGMLVLADEAHGTHFYFGEGFPIPAMAAGADLAAISMHKTGGSLTQSSIFLSGGRLDAGYLRQVINLTQTTSASYLLLSSLDLARKNLALNGEGIFRRTAELAEYAREEINALGGYYAFSKELINGKDVYDFDVTKLSVHTRDIGLAGIEVYDLLRDEYGIQIEFGDIGNILAIISAGDRNLDIERLVGAMSEIKRLYTRDKAGMFDHEYINPVVVMPPKKAFYSKKVMLPIDETMGKICGEFVMCYPPGIPILAPGEMITQETLEYIKYAKAKGCLMTGPQDMEIERLNVVEEC